VIHKLLTSAVDNAKYVSGEQGTDLDVDNLYVKTALANDGPRMKRIRPAPMGRAFRYQRRLTHIVLSVAEREGSKSLVTKVEEPVAETSTQGKEDGAQGSCQDGGNNQEKGQQEGLEGLRGKVWDRKSILTDSGWE